MLFFCIYAFAQTPKILLLKTYKDQNVSGWMMSEKLDGIRAIWDGKNISSRSGKIINAPKWFTKNLPPFKLDGELWSKRADFENIQSIVLDNIPTQKWREITYNIFELPEQKGDLLSRLDVLKSYLKTHKIEHVKLIEQIKCKNNKHLEKFFQSVKQKGGEGVVIRKADENYINKRTNKALKYKGYIDDECEVIALHKGKGKYKNLLGSFTCKLKNGIIFKIGSGLSDKNRHNLLKIGQIVTFKYQNLTKNGKPRFAVFLHVRK